MYNKLFAKILDSSIWLQPTPTRIVWLTLLAVMDQDGFCHFAAIGNLALRARVTAAEARRAVRLLEGPDPESADPDHEGRRIERVPGGWIVLNSTKYRDLVTTDVRRQQTRERVRRFRERTAAVRSGSAPVTRGNDLVAPSEAGTEADHPVDQDPRAARRLPEATTTEAVRSHLASAVHAALDVDPGIDESKLLEIAKAAAGRLQATDYTSRRLAAIVDGVRAERARRTA